MDCNSKYTKTLGLWINEKKCKKFCLPEFIEACRASNLRVVKLDLTRPLEDQGRFDVILHKMTAIYARALDGNWQARVCAQRFEKYLKSNPQIPVVDPLPGVHTLLHRSATYALLETLTQYDDRVTTPPYVELSACDLEVKKEMLIKAGLTFPIVCKPVFGCGGTEAHELAVVLSMSRLAEWEGPCVAQSFIPHSAVLYKLYVVGSKWSLDRRPSLKNFRATDAPTVHFNSANVSKAGCCSPLTQLDQSDKKEPLPQPDEAVFDRIVRMVRKSLNMDLLGIDVVIDSVRGQYAIIDVNPFPSYDSFPDLMPSLAKVMVEHASRERIVSNANASSIEDLLLPPEIEEDGSYTCRRTRVSRNFDHEKLLESRGHLEAIRKLTGTQHISIKKQASEETGVADKLSSYNGSIKISSSLETNGDAPYTTNGCVLINCELSEDLNSTCINTSATKETNGILTQDSSFPNIDFSVKPSLTKGQAVNGSICM